MLCSERGASGGGIRGLARVGPVVGAAAALSRVALARPLHEAGAPRAASRAHPHAPLRALHPARIELARFVP